MTNSSSRVSRTLAVVCSALVAALGSPASAAPPDAGASRIVFTSNRTGTSQLWSMNVDGSDQRQIIFSTQDDIMPDVSSDGRRLLFARGTGYSTSSQGGSIWVADADGSHPEPVASPPEGSANYKPAWSPDGKRIAFVRGSQAPFVQDIWVMNEDGSEQRALTTDGALNVWPSWSPDGRRIAFGKAFSQIWVMDADGSNAQLINANGNLRYTVTWGPTNRIVYTDTLPGTTNRQIRAMDPDGSNIETLSKQLDDDRFPSWSPDGECIAFSKGRQPCAVTTQRAPAACGFEIWTMAADGSDQTKIAGTEILETDLGEGYPVYVPHASVHGRGR